MGLWPPRQYLQEINLSFKKTQSFYTILIVTLKVSAVDKKEKDLYIKSGKILQAAKKRATTITKHGKSLLKIAEEIEKFIIDNGGAPAFPINLSANNTAAHFTPSTGDKSVVGEKDVLKVDIGVHIDGFITDSAVTMDFSGEFGKMLEAAESALENALSVAHDDVSIGKIGEEIEKTIKKYGFRPIANLTGHGLLQWTAHAAPSIPNIGKKDENFLETGFVYAIEPFVTDGEGYVREGVQTEIYELDEPKPVRNPDARKILSFVQDNYHQLPFAKRWISKDLNLSEFNLKVGFRELVQKKCLHSYPILNEQIGKMVTQAETTILVEEKEIMVLV